MTEAQFVRNHRGIDQGKDPAKELLEGMYRRIKVRAAGAYGHAVAARDPLPVCAASALVCVCCGPLFSPAKSCTTTVKNFTASKYVRGFFC